MLVTLLSLVFVLHTPDGGAADTRADAEADRQIAALEGVYKRRFKSGVVVPGQADETVAAEDVIELARHDRTRLYFRAVLQFYNGHSCGIHGIASRESDAFVFRDRAGGGEEESCTFRISANKTELVLTDRITPDGAATCQAFCGARGSLSEYRIPLKARRPIRYLARLKASRQYQEAVAALAAAAPVKTPR